MTDTSVLFQPFESAKLSLPNRIVMAPMTRNMSPEGVPGQPNADYYERRAAHGVGLILSEGTVVKRPSSRNLPNIPFFHSEEPLGGWQQVIEAVHAAGGKMGPQIWHTGGTTADPSFERGPLDTPSGLNKPGESVGEPMSEEAIADTIAAFAAAAADAKRLGFDTVEIHGAHGYLIDQFFWSGSNQRTDRWGGATIAERSRFAVELVKAMRAAVGPDYPILMRVSQWKQQDYDARLATTPGELEAVARPAGRCRRRHPALLAAPVLGARIPRARRRAGPQLRRLGQEDHRRADDQCRICRPFGRVPRLVSRQGRGARKPRWPRRTYGTRRIRPYRGRPGAAVRPALGREGPRRARGRIGRLRSGGDERTGLTRLFGVRCAHASLGSDRRRTRPGGLR